VAISFHHLSSCRNIYDIIAADLRVNFLGDTQLISVVRGGLIKGKLTLELTWHIIKYTLLMGLNSRRAICGSTKVVNFEHNIKDRKSTRLQNYNS